jgi:hypothetical protein
VRLLRGPLYLPCAHWDTPRPARGDSARNSSALRWRAPLLPSAHPNLARLPHRRLVQASSRSGHWIYVTVSRLALAAAPRAVLTYRGNSHRICSQQLGGGVHRPSVNASSISALIVRVM